MNPEIGFSQKIDDNLDLNDIQKLIILFKEAKSISPNCIFRYLDELFSQNRETCSKIQNENILTLLDYACNNFNHELMPIVFKAGLSKLNGNYLSVKRTLKFMKKIEEYNDYYAVLNIVYTSCKRGRKGIMAENYYDLICKKWLQATAKEQNQI